MIKKDEFLKLIFGFIIFLFSLALAYFTATYIQKNNGFDYWNTLLIFSGFYLAIGLVTIIIYPISLGFLFSADILILNTLFENFNKWDDIAKTSIVGGILIIVYLIAWFISTDKKKPIDNIQTTTGNPNFIPPSIG